MSAVQERLRKLFETDWKRNIMICHPSLHVNNKHVNNWCPSSCCASGSLRQAATWKYPCCESPTLLGMEGEGKLFALFDFE